MFKILSLRGRFLVSPFIGIILTMILYFASNSIMQSHSKLFQELSESNLPRVSEISHIIVLLSNNHAEFTALLLSTIEIPDEEQVYLNGRIILNNLYMIEELLFKNIDSKQTNSVEQTDISEQIRQAFIHYRDSIIDAIELSSVDAKLARTKLIDADEVLLQLNKTFLALSEQQVKNMTAKSMLVENSLYDDKIVTILAIVLILIMLFSALYFSNRMSYDINRSEQALIASREEADQANQTKSDFLSSMSHELRTPLNAILGFGQLLKLDSERLDATQRDNINEILNASYHLLDLINQVLDLAKIESGKLEILMDKVSVDKVLQECLSMINPQAAARQIKIINHINHIDDKVHADSSRLKQVLLNLLSNAVKYNRDQGHITVDSETINKSRLRIRIKDTGQGLTEEDIARLFTSFVRLNTTHNIEGTGIGLVISRHLIEAMNGSIGVESKPNEGSTFWFELALAAT